MFWTKTNEVQMKMVPIRPITSFIPKKIKEKNNRLIQDVSVKKL
jgi:hypothetical protein